MNRCLPRSILVVSLLLHGCDLFQTRDPQPPSQTTVGFQPPDTPDRVLENLQAAIKAHNVDYYIRCFVDTTASSRTFIFNPSGDFQGVFANWTLEDEQRWFQNIGDPASGVPDLGFVNEQQLNSTSGTTEYTMNYSLFYPHRRPDVAQLVQGYMHLYLALDSQRRWSIYRWDDTRTVTDSTWSYLKSHF